MPDPKSNDLSWFTSAKIRPDLQLGVYVKIREEDGLSLSVNLRNNEIQQVARFIKSEVWSQSGDIPSVLDLANTTLVVSGINLFKFEFDLQCIQFEIQPGRSIWIPQDKMQVSQSHPWMEPMYFFHIPDELSGLEHTCI